MSSRRPLSYPDGEALGESVPGRTYFRLLTIARKLGELVSTDCYIEDTK